MKKALSKKNLWDAMPHSIKSSVGRIAGLIPTQVLLGSNFRRWLQVARESDRWTKAQVDAHLMLQVKAICEHAEKHSAYYREVFNAVGFEPSHMRSLDALSRLPLIDKHVINDHRSRLLTVPENGPGVDFVATGGSSGEPLRFLIGADRSAPEFAHLVAAWERVGYNLDTPQAVLRGQVVSADGKGMHHYYDPLLRRHNYSNFYMNDEAMAGYLKHIATIGDCYLHTYPSSLNMLVRYLKRTGTTAPSNIKGLLIGSENVYDEDRKAAQDVFNGRYFSWYGHSEKLIFGSECEHSTNYHISPSYGFCELVDEKGDRITTPGVTGELVGTGFINRVMPFIRYRTGDYATFVSEGCAACGRNHMVITDVRGHNTLEMLVATDGSLIPWAACNVHTDTFNGVLQFQFMQNQVGRATVKVVPAVNASDLNLDRILNDMNERLQGRITFTIEVVEEITLTRNGKSVFVDQQLQTEKILTDGKQ